MSLDLKLNVQIQLTEQQRTDLLRFFTTSEDGQDYDVPDARMLALANAGLVRLVGSARYGFYEFTGAGEAVVTALSARAPQDGLGAPLSVGAELARSATYLVHAINAGSNRDSEIQRLKADLEQALEKWAMADPGPQPPVDPTAWLDPRSGRKAATIGHAVKMHNESLGGAPASASALYDVPLYQHRPTADAEIAELRARFSIVCNQRDALRHQVEALIAESASGRFRLVDITAVAVTREDPENALYLDWLLEGGICELGFPGTLLLVAQEAITNDQGDGQVYVPVTTPEKSA